jgi:hypothetical protein
MRRRWKAGVLKIPWMETHRHSTFGFLCEEALDILMLRLAQMAPPGAWIPWDVAMTVLADEGWNEALLKEAVEQLESLDIVRLSPEFKGVNRDTLDGIFLIVEAANAGGLMDKEDVPEALPASQDLADKALDADIRNHHEELENESAQGKRGVRKRPASKAPSDLPQWLMQQPLQKKLAPMLTLPGGGKKSAKRLVKLKQLVPLSTSLRWNGSLERAAFMVLVHQAEREESQLRAAGLLEKAELWRAGILGACATRDNEISERRQAWMARPLAFA